MTSPPTTQPTTAQVLAAQRHLRGHLVATPLVGGVEFPGKAPGLDLRLKPEMLQPGGSIWFRGFQNFLLGRLGGSVGLCVDGPWRRVLPGVIAGMQHRLPVWAFLWPTENMQPPRLLEQIAPDLPLAVGDAGVATAFAARTGCLRMPGPGDPAVAAGLATVALELHEQMPTDCTDVFVAAELAGALQAGFAAAGRTCSVHAVGAGKSMARFQRDFQLLHGLHLEERDFEVLAAAAGSERGPVVAVIGG